MFVFICSADASLYWQRLCYSFSAVAIGKLLNVNIIYIAIACTVVLLFECCECWLLWNDMSGVCMCISLISMNTFHFLKLLDKVFPNTSVQYTIFLFRLRDVKYLKIGSALERLLFCNPTKWIQIETEKITLLLCRQRLQYYIFPNVIWQCSIPAFFPKAVHWIDVHVAQQVRWTLHPDYWSNVTLTAWFSLQLCGTQSSTRI